MSEFVKLPDVGYEFLEIEKFSKKHVQEEFEDTKGVTRIRKSKKNRRYKRTNNDLQNTHIKRNQETSKILYRYLYSWIQTIISILIASLPIFAVAERGNTGVILLKSFFWGERGGGYG